jgi:hypothetical protein
MYLYTYDLYSPVHNVLDACDVGKWEGVGLWNSRVFRAPVKWELADRRVPFGALSVGELGRVCTSHSFLPWNWGGGRGGGF